MQDLSSRAIAKLLESPATRPKVTLYIPMRKSAAPPHIIENQLHFKKAVNGAVSLLKGRPDGISLGSQLADYLDQRLSDKTFLENQTQGLLLTAEKDLIQTFYLPVDTEEYTAVDTNYHLAPVLGLLHDQQMFFVLVVAQHSPRLLRGTMYGLQRTAVVLPESIESAFNIDEAGLQRELSQSAGGKGGFNGRGGNRDTHEAERLRFFRLIDKQINKFVPKNAPLILAGTETEAATFRGISRHPHILSETINGGFFGGDQIHLMFEKARLIMDQEVVLPDHRLAVNEYDRLAGTNLQRIEHDPTAIAEAAKQGRIKTLLLGLSHSTADTVRGSLKPVKRLSFPSDELSALANKAAAAVAQASGRVINVDQGLRPGGKLLAAVLRY
jgi:hypothetical protein